MSVDPAILLALTLAFLLSALFAAAVFYDLTVFRRRKNNGSKAVYRCANCRYIYTVPRRTPLARCPQCGQHNEPVRE